MWDGFWFLANRRNWDALPKDIQDIVSKHINAAGLAERLGVDFIEGDALHPQANVNKMAGGVPLSDEDRWPWLDAIGERIEAERAAGTGVVVSCSALKHVYRDCLRKKVNGRVRFILLDGPRDLISSRMLGRKGHFLPQALLASWPPWKSPARMKTP